MTDTTIILKLIDIFFNFLNYTKEYIFNISKLFINSKAPLPMVIIGIAFLYSILKGGILDNWKIIAGAVIVGIIVSIIYQ